MNDEWELKPENGHPAARKLLPEEFYWDCTDDNSPLGNDSGADVLAFYQEALESGAQPDAAAFLDQILQDWDMPFDDWDLVDPQAVSDHLEENPHTIPSVDDAVIGLAFAMLILHGVVDARIRRRALAAVSRESLDVVIEERGWVDPEARVARLADIRGKLEQMPMSA